MSKKEEILKLLEKSLYWEDEFIVKYDTSSNWAFLKTLPKNKFGKIEKLFKENIDDTRKHYKLVNEIIEKIRSEEYEL